MCLASEGVGKYDEPVMIYRIRRRGKAKDKPNQQRHRS